MWTSHLGYYCLLISIFSSNFHVILLYLLHSLNFLKNGDENEIRHKVGMKVFFAWIKEGEDRQRVLEQSPLMRWGRGVYMWAISAESSRYAEEYEGGWNGSIKKTSWRREAEKNRGRKRKRGRNAEEAEHDKSEAEKRIETMEWDWSSKKWGREKRVREEERKTSRGQMKRRRKWKREYEI